MQAPSDSEQRRAISTEFWSKWQSPNCLGAIDVKAVVMIKPWLSGSLYFNYKGTCLTVLMALVDANMKFRAIDIGSSGRNSDGGIFSNCPFGKRFITSDFNFPQDKILPNFQRAGPLP